MNESEQYKEICKKHFDDIIDKLDILNDRLFMDNGDCLQSKINKNSLWIRIITGVFATVGTLVLSILAWMIKGKL